MAYVGYLIILKGESINIISFRSSIAFDTFTLEKFYPKQQTRKIGYAIDDYGLKHVTYLG